jgi:hypothetical protein
VPVRPRNCRCPAKQLLRRIATRLGTRIGDPDSKPGGLIAAIDPERPPTIVDDRGNTRPPSMPDGTRLYVVGDIHGELDSLQRVILRIRTDIAASPVEHVSTVFLGDYIDRGLASKSVIDTIIAEPGIGRKIALRGNHEAMLLQALDDPAWMQDWCEAGGIATCISTTTNNAGPSQPRQTHSLRSATIAYPWHPLAGWTLQV